MVNDGSPVWPGPAVTCAEPTHRKTTYRPVAFRPEAGTRARTVHVGSDADRPEGAKLSWVTAPEDSDATYPRTRGEVSGGAVDSAREASAQG